MRKPMFTEAAPRRSVSLRPACILTAPVCKTSSYRSCWTMARKSITGPAVANQQSAVWGCLANGRGEAAAYLADRGAQLTFATAAGVGKLDVFKQYFGRSGKPKRNISQKDLEQAFRLACAYEIGR